MIKLFIDSGCNLSKELKEKYGISVLETEIRFNGIDYKSGVTWEYFSPQEMYDFMSKGGLPEISQSSIGNWMEQLKEKIESPSDEIVYIATSSKIAGSFRVFNILMNMNHDIPNRLHVVESIFGGPSPELITLETARNLTKNSTFEDIRNFVDEMKGNIHLYDISGSMKSWVFTGRADKSKKFEYPEGIPLIKGIPDGAFVPMGLFHSFEDALDRFSEEMKSLKVNKCVFNYTYNTSPDLIDRFKEIVLDGNADCEILADHISSPTSSAISGLDSVNVAFI